MPLATETSSERRRGWRWARRRSRVSPARAVIAQVGVFALIATGGVMIGLASR